MSDRNGRRPHEPENQPDLPPEEELANTIEELDKVCARTRQLIYRLRPLLRPEQEERQAIDEERPRRTRPPAQFSGRRQARR